MVTLFFLFVTYGWSGAASALSLLDGRWLTGVYAGLVSLASVWVLLNGGSSMWTYLILSIAATVALHLYFENQLQKFTPNEMYSKYAMLTT